MSFINEFFDGVLYVDSEKFWGIKISYLRSFKFVTLCLGGCWRDSTIVSFLNEELSFSVLRLRQMGA